jgi:hypothetical protein
VEHQFASHTICNKANKRTEVLHVASQNQQLSSGYAAGSIEHPIRSAVPSNLVLRFQSIYRATENSPEISLPPTIGCLAGRQKWLHFRHSPMYCSKRRPALASSWRGIVLAYSGSYSSKTGDRPTWRLERTWLEHPGPVDLH